MKLCIAIAVGIAMLVPDASAKPSRAISFPKQCVQLFHNVDAHDRKLTMLSVEQDMGSATARLLNSQSTANEIAGKAITIQTMAALKCPLPSVLQTGAVNGSYSSNALECLLAKGDKAVDDYMTTHGDQSRSVDMKACRLQDWVGSPPVVYPPDQ
jgi:hypothetical protein